MSKNLIINGRTLKGVTALKATDADTKNLVLFNDTSDANAIASDIQSNKTAYVNGVKVNGTNTGVVANDLDGIVDGTIVAFVMPSGKTSILQYRFTNFTSLTSANLGGATTIGQYAFDGCTRLSGVSLPGTLTNIGEYAFRNLCASSGSTFILQPTAACTVGTYAFNSSKIAKIKGVFGSIGTYSFANCTSLNEIDIKQCTGVSDYAFQNDTAITNFALKVNGSVGAGAFYNLYQISSCKFDSSSIISSLGNYAFSRFASNRSNSSSNIITLDLRNSTFTSIPQYSFGSDSSSTMYRNKYMKIMFPDSVTTIDAYSFSYTDYCEFYFAKATPATLSSTTCWSNATNYSIFVPYTAVNAYRTATNWTAQTAYIKGFAPNNTFELGSTLPMLNAGGYSLTWYSDSACATKITTVTDANAFYYCIVGTEKSGYIITSVTAVDCSVVITDTNGKTYSQGEGVLTGTVLTITGVPNTAGYVPYIFMVNGKAFTSGNTITVNADLSITAIYYNGHDIPIDPIFANNTWSIIYQAFRAGTASQFWSVGNTKSITLTNGNTMTIRIADMKAGRYTLADGSGKTNGVLEFVELFPSYYPINSTSKEGYWTGGGWALCDMHNTTLNSTIWALLHDDLKAAMSEISLSEYSYTSPAPRASTNKLFLPAETEMYDARCYSAEGTGTYPKYDQFGYYVTNNTNAARVKYNGTSSYYYWLRSPYSGGSNHFCMVGSNGGCAYVNANNSYGVAPCFAI